MSLPWMWGGYSTGVGTAETNAPSLWSGGIAWADGSTQPPNRGYWQSSANPTERTGPPLLSVAIGGRLVTNAIMSADWSLGRDEWLSVLQPSAASLMFEGSVSFDPMDEVVIGVMSTVTDQHSASLWVGYAETLAESTDASGRVTTSVSGVDIIGLLGMAPAPYSMAQGTIPEVVAALADASGIRVVVDDEGRSGPNLGAGASTGNDESALSYLNRAEQAANAMVVLRGRGRLYSVHRLASVGVPDADDLDADDPPSDWTVERSPTGVVNSWPNLADPIPGQATEIAASKRRYGTRAFAPDQSLAMDDNWIDVWASGVLLSPRPLLSSAETPITDLSQPTLFLDPLDRVVLGGRTWQVMSVRHSAQPGRRWRVTFAGDVTQDELVGSV